MAKTVNTENFPWSIKGISIEARKLAKEGAAKEGLTIGQWLKQIIKEMSFVKKLAVQVPSCQIIPPRMLTLKMPLQKR